MTNSIGGIILAAGASARMLRPKALLPWGQTTVVQSIVNTLTKTQISPILLVVRGDEVGAQIASLTQRSAQSVINPDPERGMLSSLHIAARALLDRGVTRALITPVDQPQITAQVCRALCLALEQNQWAIASHQGVWGHPYAAADLEDLLQEARSAQHLLQKKNPRLIEGGPGVLLNLNTPEEYQLAYSLYQQRNPS